MRLAALVCITVLASASAALAQDPMTSAAKSTLGLIKGNVVKAAEQMSEENYAFKPTPDVRSFGQLIGHIADANYMICSSATGAANPNTGSVEKTKTIQGGPDQGGRRVLRVLRSPVRRAAGRESRRGRRPVRHEDAAAQRAAVQHRARLRALRQHRHLHAPQGHGAAEQPAGHVKHLYGARGVRAARVQPDAGRSSAQPAGPRPGAHVHPT